MFRSNPAGIKNRSGAACARKFVAKRSRADRLLVAAVCMESMERRRLLSGTLAIAPQGLFSTGVKSAPLATVVADLNGDGIPDLVVESANGDISILLGKGDGTFKSTQVVYDHISTSSVAGPQSLAVETVNGTPAILVSSQNSDKVSILTANSHGLWSVYGGAPLSHVGDGSHINGVTVANLGGTSFLVTANEDGSVSLSKIIRGTTGFAGVTGTAVSINTVISGSPALDSLAIGNFITKGNGNDLVVVGSNGMAELLPGQNGGFGTPVAISGITAGQTVFNTGTSGLILLNSDGNLTPLMGQQSSTATMAFTNFGATVSAPLSGAELVTIGDFNGDGKPDLIVSNGGGMFKVLTGDGAGTYTSAGTYSRGNTSLTEYGLTAGDFRGDGISDLVGSYYNSGNGSAQVGVSLNVTPPVFNGANNAQVTVGSPFTHRVTTTAFPFAKLTVSGGLPPGVSFKDNGNGTGTFSGATPGAVNKGTYTVNIKATTASGTVTQAFTFDMTQAAKFNTGTSVTFHEGKSQSFKIRASNGFSNGSLPTFTATLGGAAISHSTFVNGLTFTDNLDGTATLSGTPTSPGVLTMLVKAGTASQVVQVTILGPPSFGGISNSFSFVVGTSATTGAISLTNPGTPFPVINVRNGFQPALPKGLKFFDNGNGTFTISGTAPKGSGGTYVGHLYAHNDQGSATPFTFTVIVSPFVQYTSANNTTFTVGKTASFVIRTSGSTVASFTGGSSTTTGDLPAGLTFMDNTNGTATISGTPPAGTGGTYLLSLSDHAGDTQMFTLTIDEAPTFTSNTGSASVSKGMLMTPITVTAVPGYKNTKLSVSGKLPAGVRFTDSGNGVGSITGTPSANSEGTYIFKILASNEAGIATQTYTLTVT